MTGGGGGEKRLEDMSRSLFRSDPMVYLQIYVPRETAHSMMTVLGQLGVIAFTDVYTPLSRYPNTFIAKQRKVSFSP